MMTLERLAWKLREDTLDLIVAGQNGHIGGDMSVMEILTVLYFDEMNVSPGTQSAPDRDRFLMSKGHSMEAYYAVLAERGFLDREDLLRNYFKENSPYIGHPNNKLPGIEMNSGSLGHGLPVGVGMAIASAKSEKPFRVYVVMGDGELAEGSIWEAAMAGSHYHLGNLCAVVDRNRLQISGTTEEVMHQEDLVKRWESFGWNALRVDGNSVEELRRAFAAARKETQRPTVIIADTIKGKGSPLMENKASWHHHVPTQEEYLQIKRDLHEKWGGLNE